MNPRLSTSAVRVLNSLILFYALLRVAALDPLARGNTVV